MKKNIKRIIAIISLIAIAVLIILFFISAFIEKPESGNIFFALFFCIITIPILAWLFLFCYGRFTGNHTMAEPFPENYNFIPDNNLNESNCKTPTDADVTDAKETCQK